MAFAYVVEPYAVIRRRGRTLLVERDGHVLAEWKLTGLQSLLLCGQIHLTAPAARLLLQQGIETAFLDRRGQLVGQLTPPKPANIMLRMLQYRCSQDPATRLQLASQTVAAKIRAQIAVLQQHRSNHPAPELKVAQDTLEQSLLSATRTNSLDQLRGVEGFAARTYWTAFRSMLRGDLPFEGRSHRPPRDPVNALLSLGYTFLTNELTALLDALGFDPWLGFYHDLQNQRPALALDLMEPLRHAIVDRIVLKLVNRRQLTPDDFRGDESLGFRLTTAGWKVFISAWEDGLQRATTWESFQGSQRELLRWHCDQLRQSLQAAGPQHDSAGADDGPAADSRAAATGQQSGGRATGTSAAAVPALGRTVSAESPPAEPPF